LPAALDTSPGPSDIPWLSHAFPLSAPVGVTAEGVRQTIMDKLPRMQIAKSLCETYYRHAAWMCVFISHALARYLALHVNL